MAQTEPQVPTISRIAAQGVEALKASRPSAAPFVFSGVWSHLLAGWKAQVRLLHRRLVDEVAAARLPTSEGTALAELVRSEFNGQASADQQTGVGEVTITRTLTDTNAILSEGIIPAGTKFAKAADPVAIPAVEAAEYRTTAPVHVINDTVGVLGQPGSIQTTNTSLGAGQYSHVQTVTLGIEATRSGPHANTPRFGSNVGIALADAIFTSDFSPSRGGAATGLCAGGSSGQNDARLRRLARALSTGQYGPTEGAILAGALGEAGVAYAVALPDPIYGRTVVFVADESWAYSGELLRRTTRSLKDTRVGFGCRIDVRGIENVLVAISATAILTDRSHIDQPDDITKAIVPAVQAYLDDRDDFYIFRTASLGATIAFADSRILTCAGSPAPAVTNVATGLALSEPSQPVISDQNPTPIQHYMLAAQASRITYASPS